jgi:DNA-binding transcriptional MerR regulator
MNNFSIKDVESLTGIKPHTLRIWEQRYGIPHPKRTATNIRYYDDEDIKLLLSVAMLNRQGHKISKISQMSREVMHENVIELSNNSKDQVVQLEVIIAAMFSLDEVAFETVFSTSVLQIGLERTFIEIVLPLMGRIGMLWQTGSLNPAYEHFITNLIRQRLFVAIDNQPKNILASSKKFVLFLPPSETHELGLLFSNYLIRSRGHHTSYLGPNLPLDELTSVMQVYKADYLLTVVTMHNGANSPLQIVNKLASDFPKTKILIGGNHQLQANINLPSNIKLMGSLYDFIDFLDRLK